MRRIISYFFISFFILSCPKSSIAQKIDSLQYALKSAGEDTNRVTILKLLSSACRSKDTALSRNYAMQSFKLAQKLGFNKGMGSAYIRLASLKKITAGWEASITDYQMALMYYGKENYDKGIMQTYLELAGVYRHVGKYDDAFNFYTKLKQLAEKVGDRSYLVDALGGYANIYRYKDDYVNSLDYYQKGISLAETIGDKDSEASLLMNMAIIYEYQKNFDEEFKIRKRTLELYEEMHDSVSLILAISNLGGMYYDKGNKTEALKYYNRSLDIIKKIGVDRAGYKYVSDSYQNLGMLAMDNNNYGEALANYQKALDYMIRGQEKKGIANAYGDLANVYMKMNNWAEAEKAATRKLEISEEIGYKRGMMEAFGYLADIRNNAGDFKNAYRFLSRYTGLHDSIINEKSNEALADMQTKYQTEKKEHQVQLLEAGKLSDARELKMKNILNYIFIGASLVFLLMGFFVFRQYRQKKKANALLETQNEEISLKSEQINLQKEIIETKNKDITDSIHYAKHIQEAILPSDDLVYEYLKECFILYKPRDVVSGDFYWVHKYGDNSMFSVVDCTGHGVPGALMSVIAHGAIRSVVHAHTSQPPSIMLNYLQDAMKEIFKHQYKHASVNDGMDTALCSLDRKNMKLKYAGARIPLCLVRGEELIEIKGDKHTIAGNTEDVCIPFTFHEMDVKKGDNIYIFSDGYADQFGGAKGKKFKYNSLKQLLLSVALKPLHRQKQVLDQTIEEWRGSLEQVDDILVIGVRV